MLRIFTVIVFALGLVVVPSVARGDDKADAKGFISKQVDLIKAGKLDDLKGTFTKRLQDRITKEAVDKAAAQAGKITVDEMVDSVAKSGDGLKIKMKNGRTLTTLVKEDGAWKADTIWFK